MLILLPDCLIDTTGFFYQVIFRIMKAKQQQQQQAHKNEATSAERPDPYVSIVADWLIEED